LLGNVGRATSGMRCGANESADSWFNDHMEPQIRNTW
jgi:hypothetical protein